MPYGKGSFASPIVIEDSDSEVDETRKVQQRQAAGSVLSSRSRCSAKNTAAGLSSSPGDSGDCIVSGIGYNILVGMGYEPGLGLGPNLEGVVHPISTKVVPLTPRAGLGAEIEAKPGHVKLRSQVRKKTRRKAALALHDPSSIASSSSLPTSPIYSLHLTPQETHTAPEAAPDLMDEDATPEHGVHDYEEDAFQDSATHHDQPWDGPYDEWEEDGGHMPPADLALAAQSRGYDYFGGRFSGNGVATASGLGQFSTTDFSNLGHTPSIDFIPFLNPMFVMSGLPPLPVPIPPLWFPLTPGPDVMPPPFPPTSSQNASFVPPSAPQAIASSSSQLSNVPGPYDVTLNANDTRTIGMDVDIKPESTRGCFPKALPVHFQRRSLVMEVLPRKFRNLEFIHQWLSSLDTHSQTPPTVRLHIGKALIIFDSESAAKIAWSSPRMGGLEGLQSVRLFWYRPPAATLSAPDEPIAGPSANGSQITGDGADETTAGHAGPSLVPGTSDPIVPAVTSAASVAALPDVDSAPIDNSPLAPLADEGAHIVLSSHKKSTKPALSISTNHPRPPSTPAPDPSQAPSFPQHDTTFHSSSPSSSTTPTFSYPRPQLPALPPLPPLDRLDSTDMRSPASLHLRHAVPRPHRLQPSSIEALPQTSGTPLQTSTPQSQLEPIRLRHEELEAKVAKARAELAAKSTPTPLDGRDAKTASDAQARETSLRRLVLLSKRKRSDTDDIDRQVDVAADPDALLEPSKQSVVVFATDSTPRRSSVSPPRSQPIGLSPSVEDMANAFIAEAIGAPRPPKRVRVSTEDLLQRMSALATESKKLMGQLEAAGSKLVRSKLTQQIREHSRMHDVARDQYNALTAINISKPKTISHALTAVSVSNPQANSSVYRWPETDRASLIILLHDDAEEEEDE
ncbi:hypothetical protein FA95DRAFT_1561584 [Auriscalpium vulgare]|uniref:Uncharacterized protein n=1 Tax=Auriscalpium vulgare TaxID=40419 RepID=A0ACB8RLN2_9AGAM|nr:hypothetical protein FA95DRAFT_1561584 [Auriscalpium vulgare]